VWPAEEISLGVIDAQLGEQSQRFVVFDPFCDRLVTEVRARLTTASTTWWLESLRARSRTNSISILR